MTILSRTPETTDLLQPTKFLLNFGKIDMVQYFCQTVNIPGMSIGEANYNVMPMNLNVPGNKLSFSKLEADFIIDEKLQGWQQMYNWFQSIASPEGFEERSRLTKMNRHLGTKPSYYSDAILTILNALNNPVARLKFVNVFPVSMSDIQLDTKLSADTIITSKVTFNFDYYTFEKV